MSSLFGLRCNFALLGYIHLILPFHRLFSRRKLFQWSHRHEPSIPQPHLCTPPHTPCPTLQSPTSPNTSVAQTKLQCPVPQPHTLMSGSPTLHYSTHGKLSFPAQYFSILFPRQSCTPAPHSPPLSFSSPYAYFDVLVPTLQCPVPPHTTASFPPVDAVFAMAHSLHNLVLDKCCGGATLQVGSGLWGSGLGSQNRPILEDECFETDRPSGLVP